MKSDLIDELQAADPARAHAAGADPDWAAMARQILAAPRQTRQTRRRRRPLAFALAAGAAVTAAAALALAPSGAPPTVLERAYAAVNQNAVYHYVVTSQELEGPQRNPVAGTRAAREGWIDPTTGEIHEISENGDEWATDGRRRMVYTAFNNTLQEYDELPPADTSEQAPTHVLAALTRSLRAGALSDKGLAVFEGQQVRRLVAHNPGRTWRQTFLVDADSYLPVLMRSETGEHVRDSSPIGPRQRVIEERFQHFERLPDDTNRSVLKMRPHPDAAAASDALPRAAEPPRAAAP